MARRARQQPVLPQQRISDGNAHRKFDMPVVLAGSAGGKLKVDGTHYNYYPRMTFPRPLVVDAPSPSKKGSHSASRPR